MDYIPRVRFGDPWTAQQRALVDDVFEAWWMSAMTAWPKYAYVAESLDDQGLSAIEVLRSFPYIGIRQFGARAYADVHFDTLHPEPPDDSDVFLTVGGLARHPSGGQIAEAYLAVLRVLAEIWREQPIPVSEVKTVTVTSDQLLTRLPYSAKIITAAGQLFRTEPMPAMRSWGGSPDSSWVINFDRRIRRYAGVTLERYLQLITDLLSPPESSTTPTTQQVAPSWLMRVTDPKVMRMQPSQAIRELQKLKQQATTDEVQVSGPAHDSWKTKVRVVLQRALGPGATVLGEFEKVRYSLGIYTGGPGEEERDRLRFAEGVRSAVALIDAAIYELQLEQDPEDAAAKPPAATETSAGSIFIVHGHDGGFKESVARLLSVATPQNVVILHEQPDEGQTIIEKFESHASQALFAVVLLTPDDEGRARRSGEMKPRARQNVILELGYFLGRLGRSRVVALYSDGVELPSDLAGILYKPIDSAGSWKYALLKELRAAGIEADLNKVS